MQTYQLAASATLFELDALLRDAASIRTPSGRLLLHALLTRYAELDIDAALRAVRELDVERAVLVSFYTEWIRPETDAVLAALREIEDRGDGRSVATALLHTIEGDERIARRILAALPVADRKWVRADAILASAPADPAAALEDALAFEAEDVRFRLVQQVGIVWAEADPAGALSASASIRDRNLRSAYEGVVLSTWMRTDGEAMLQYVATFDALSQERLMSSVDMFGRPFDAISPLRLIELADGLAHEPAERVRRVALRRLAADDPLRAIEMVERRATSNAQRRDLYAAIAEGYARLHPDEAFDWARRTGDAPVIHAALAGVAQIDPERAVDLALSLGAEVQYFAFDAVFQHAANSTDAASLAQRVFDLNDGELRNHAMQALADAWTRADPSGAIAWLTSQKDRIDPQLFAQIAPHVADLDLALALAYTDRVPEESIAQWTHAVISRYAHTDPDGALQWILGRRGRPGYEAAVVALVEYAATYDLTAATRLVAELDAASEYASRAVGGLAFAWIQEGFEAAAGWVGTFQDPKLKGVAAEAVVSEWVRRDAVAARSWALGLPPGEARDKALGRLWWFESAGRTFDHSLLEAFASDKARDDAILASLNNVLVRDEEAARELVERFMTDSTAIARAELLIEAHARSSPSGTLPIILQ
ncbi:MAG TPA: hypothetical protein VF329_02060 [Gammaproteobacteria bacterium]